MSDLISRSALIELIQKDIEKTASFMNIAEKYDGSFDKLYGQLNTLRNYKSIISDIPTAYDVEKVVENINNIDTRRNWNSSCEECINHTTCKEIYNEEAKTKSNHLCSQVIKKLAIKEVRKGGME